MKPTKGKNGVKMSAEQKPPRNVLDVPAVVERINALIESGALKEPEAIKKIADTLSKEFESLLGNKKILPANLKRRLPGIVWKDRTKLVRQFVAHSLEYRVLYERLSYLPKAMVKARIKELRGHEVPKRAVKGDPGFGRLPVPGEFTKQSHRVKLPEAKLDNPFVIPVPNPSNFSLMFVNGPLIGAAHNKIFNENILRCAINEARKSGDGAVFITGGLMLLDVAKSQGHLTTHRAVLSGIDFDPDVLDPEYREEAKRIRKDLPADEVTFETIRQRFENLLGGYRKIFTNEDGTPVFKGNVYPVFGLLEEELVEAAAHYEIKRVVDQMRAKATRDRKAQEALWRAAMKDDDIAAAERYQDEINRLMGLEKTMIQSNVSHEDRKRFVNALRLWITKRIEETIPNSRVISQGTAFIKAGDQMIEIHQMREASPSDGFLDSFLKKNAGRRGLDNSLSDVVLLASPYSVNARWAVSERMRGKERASTHVIQLGAALDKSFLRKTLAETVRKVSPFERLIRHEQFEPSVLRLVHGKRYWEPQMLRIDYLKRSFEVASAQKKGPKDPSVEYIYCFITTDQHFGHPWKEFYFDAKSGNWLSHEMAVIEILRREYTEKGELIPIHAYWSLDDGTQGHHFPTQSQPHQHMLPYATLERDFGGIREAAIQAGTRAEALAKLEELHKQALEQVRVRGEHWPQSQVEEFYDRMIEPNIQFFADVLLRAHKGKVKFLGVSEIHGTRFDTRDIANIVHLSGNHFGNTVENELTEGFFYTRMIRIALKGNSKLPKEVHDNLERLVRAPLMGNTPIGLGRIKAANGYEWGISLRRDPPKKSGQNGDPLRGAATSVMQRGDFSRIFTGHHTVHVSGDIHRYGYVQLSDALVVSCAPGTDTDPYGERGFSPNNVGNMIIGLPKDGPNSGPIRIMPINHDFVRAHLLNPLPIDWRKLFSNPV